MTNKGVRLTLIGDHFNNSGGGRTFTLRVKYGATTLFNDVSANIGVHAARHELRIALELFNQGATNDQIMQGSLALGADTATTAGRGDLAASSIISSPFGGDSAEDSTAAKDLVVTVQHSIADANLSLRRQLAILELL